MRSFFSSASVSSSLALAMISPVSASTMLRASDAADQVVLGHADVRGGGGFLRSPRVAGGDALVLGDDDLFHLSVMSKRATSPRRRSGTNSICAPLSIRRKLSLTKKFARIDSASGRWP